MQNILNLLDKFLYIRLYLKKQINKFFFLTNIIPGFN